MHRTYVKVLEDVLDANGTIAAANRDDFDRAGVTAVNLMSAPGAGKTTLLERSLRRLGARVGVLEGDVASTLDAERIARLHVPVVQIDTEPSFGGECHLDANMVRSALPSLPLDELDLLVIENVGNLVCRWPRARTSRSSTRSCSAPASSCSSTRSTCSPTSTSTSTATCATWTRSIPVSRRCF
jgi:hydrogenase accessory protein HypB